MGRLNEAASLETPDSSVESRLVGGVEDGWTYGLYIYIHIHISIFWIKYVFCGLALATTKYSHCKIMNPTTDLPPCAFFNNAISPVNNGIMGTQVKTITNR